MLLPMNMSSSQEDPSPPHRPPLSPQSQVTETGVIPDAKSSPRDADTSIDVYVGGPPVMPLPAAADALKTHAGTIERRVGLPVVLFLLTCFTTFSAGCYHWYPTWIGGPATYGNTTMSMSQVIAQNWSDGLLFMVCVMAVLMFHEMGHFLMTVKHRVHASYPHFIPFPMMIIGTMGAVIGMDRQKMDRKSLFDIGIAGPLAGLVLIVPFVIVGIMTATPGPREFGDPLLVKILTLVLRPELSGDQQLAVNPIYMAGWVGMLVTGLNMIPISQLDGGHVSHAVFGKYGKWVSRAVVFGVIAWMVWTDIFQWAGMLILVILLGIEHPPTTDDTIDIGWGRRILGIASFAIPVLCFTPLPFDV